MLKISEMAKLADTTRRTLIFYDEQDLFKPAKKNESGYRYYDYNQLYDLMFILGLRNLGISLEEIKNIKNNSATSSKQLVNAQTRIEDKIKELSRIQKIISKKIKTETAFNTDNLYKPSLENLVSKVFWCSRKSVSCTEEEIAQLFSEFYKQLDSLTVMDTSESGFLTDLSVDDPSGYADASFRVIKEEVDQTEEVFIPVLKKKAGNYVCILVENNVVGINHGLTILKEFCQQNGLKTQAHLWQINSDDSVIENGATKYGWLEYAVV